MFVGLVRFCAIFSGKLGQPVESVRISPQHKKCFLLLHWGFPIRVARSQGPPGTTFSTTAPDLRMPDTTSSVPFPTLLKTCLIPLLFMFTNLHQHLHKPAHLSSSCQLLVESSSRCSAGLAEAGNLPASAHLEAIQTRFNQFNGQKHGQNQTV